MPRHRCGRCSMAKEISIVHHADRRTDVMMPYAPGIVVRRGSLVFLSGVTAAAVYHSHPHREEEFDLPATMEEQAVRAMENLRKTLEAAGCTLGDLVAATRYLTDLGEQDALNREWARYLGGHLPTTTTVAGLRRGTVHVERSTVSPEAVRAIAAEVASRGADLLDAPVSGSPVTLEAGQLSFMIGGDPATLERVRPYLAAIGPTLTHVGAVGLAKAMKIAINQGLAVQLVAFSEAVLLAEKAGIARERAVEALLRSVLASPMLKYRGPFVLGMPAEAWFDVGMMQKDLKLALDLGRATGVPLSSVAIANELLTAARGMGLGRYDFAVVFDVLATMSGQVPSHKT